MKIIAGPCQHETLEQSLEIAQECKRVCEKYGVEYYFKASYDKANRTSMSGKRGLGLEKTMYDFRSLKEQLEVNTLTDVHDINQVTYIDTVWGDSVDVIKSLLSFVAKQILLELVWQQAKRLILKKDSFLHRGMSRVFFRRSKEPKKFG